MDNSSKLQHQLDPDSDKSNSLLGKPNRSSDEIDKRSHSEQSSIRDDHVEDRRNTVFWIAFVYGVATMSPFNAVLSTLDFFEEAMPDYPIAFVVSFAINGIMVVVVMACIAYPEVGSHGAKISLMFLITSVILVAIPFITDQTSSKVGPGACYYVIVGVLCLLGAITAVS